MTRQRALPPANSPTFLARVREVLQSFMGAADPEDQLLSLRALRASGLVSTTGSGAVVPGSAVDPAPDLLPPPTPPGFTVTVGATYTILQVALPVYTQGHGHRRTRVYSAPYSGAGPLPVFSAATEYADFTGVVAVVPVAPTENLRFWALWESVDGVLSVTPAGGTNGLATVVGQVSDAMIASVSAAKLLPAPAAGEVLIGDGAIYAKHAVSGDAALSSAGALTVANNAISYAKMQDVSAASVLLGRGAGAGAGDPQEIALGTGLSMSGSTLNAAAGSNPMLANVTLGVAGTSLASGTFTACKFLEVWIYIPSISAADTPSLQCNGDTAANYRYKWTYQAAAATAWTAGLTAVSATFMKLGAIDSARVRNIKVEFVNNTLSLEKLASFVSSTGSNSAAANTNAEVGTSAWFSAAATQITSLTLISTSNMAAGTQMLVFGWN